MTERKSKRQQSHTDSDASDNHQLTPDLTPEQQKFNEWLSVARASEDIRNRFAVAGGTVSRGAFGNLYLLVPDRQKVISTVTHDQSMQRLAANHSEYEPQQASSTR